MHTFVRSAIGATIVTFKGSFDTSEVPAADRKVKEVLVGGEKNLIIDLTGVSHISSSGIGMLVTALKATRAVRGDARLAGALRTVREALKMTGLDKLFRIYPDVDSALEKFAMDINETEIDGVMVINLRGDIEPIIAPALLERLRTFFGRAPGRAVLNLGGVHHASVEGLRALQEARKSAAELAVDLRLAGVEGALKDAFNLKGITPLFQIFPQVETAVGSFEKH